MKLLIRNELTKMYHKKIIHILLFIQIMTFIYSYCFNNTIFKSERYYLTNSYSINLIITYLFSSIFITIMFSKEKEEGFHVVNLTSHFSRSYILLSKILSLTIIFTSLTIFHVIIYSCISLISGYQTMSNVLIMNVIFQFINILPLICFSLILILFDIVIDSSALTTVFGFILIMSAGIIPRNISKYFITYYTNLPATILYFEEFNIFQIIILLCIYLVVPVSFIYVIYMKKQY